ncbi:MAG: hypothetical protein QXT45_04225 [Candidatus Bilamarchaeaceae archaeon]
MAEILIKAVDAYNVDPEVDKACYKAGMPVVVMPDGHKWGREEGPPKFIVLKLPGVPVEEVKKYVEEWVVEDIDKDSGYLKSVMIRRRRWRFALEQLPREVLDNASSTGKIVVDWDVVKNYFVDMQADFSKTRGLL